MPNYACGLSTYLERTGFKKLEREGGVPAPVSSAIQDPVPRLGDVIVEAVRRPMLHSRPGNVGWGSMTSTRGSCDFFAPRRFSAVVLQVVP